MSQDAMSQDVSRISRTLRLISYFPSFFPISLPHQYGVLSDKVCCIGKLERVQDRGLVSL